MTSIEFSRKYGVDYNTVYKAASTIQTTAQAVRDKEYDEEKLRRAVRLCIQKKIEKCKKNVEILETMMGRLDSGMEGKE